MSDERRQNSTVNLQELERQLREAARARQRAQASADTLSGVQAERLAERPAAQSIPNPPSRPATQRSQPGLPLSAPQDSAPPSFRPLTSSPSPQLIQPAPTGVQQANSYFSPQSREAASSHAPPAAPSFSATPSFSVTRDQSIDDDQDVLKTDHMGDVYPAVEAGAVGQDQFFSAAAYEEPAENAYDRYTEDQFPRIQQERRSSGLVKIALWLIVIAVIGLGGYIALPLLQTMIMPSSQTAKVPPLIKADPNPVKVEPETQPQDSANAPKDIFTKHANEDPKTAQLAASPEQPTDVNAAAKSGAAAQAPGSKPAIMPLVPGTGEPRLVKTVTVRADGTIIPEKSDPALAAKTAAPSPKVITIPQPVAPLPAAASAAANVPNLPAKPVAESPDFSLEGPIPVPPERNAQAGSEMNLPLGVVTTPLPAAPAPTAPVAVPASATSAPSAPVAVGSGKDYAVQFGAPETEAKGNDLKARIEKQFASALSGGIVTVMKGDNNGKPVFRVRAVGYSREEANAVCQQVSAAGGQCFVSKNN